MINKSKKLSCSVFSSSNSTKKFNGKNFEVNDFFKQFEPYWRERGTRNTLAIIENNLKGVALHWVVGCKGVIFWELYRFCYKKSIYFCRWGKIYCADSINLWNCKRLQTQEAYQMLLRVFSIRNRHKIELRVIITAAVRCMPGHIVREMTECTNWTELSKKYKQVDHDFMQERWHFSKSKGKEWANKGSKYRCMKILACKKNLFKDYHFNAIVIGNRSEFKKLLEIFPKNRQETWSERHYIHIVLKGKCDTSLSPPTLK